MMTEAPEGMIKYHAPVTEYMHSERKKGPRL